MRALYFFCNTDTFKKLNYYTIYNRIIYFKMTLYANTNTTTMNEYKSDELIEAIKTHIFHKAILLFKKSEEKNIFSKETWEPIFNELKYQLKYYLNIIQTINPLEQEEQNEEQDNNQIPIIYTSEKLNDFIERLTDLNRLGPYDYIEFYKRIKDPKFKQHVKQSYEKVEHLKKIKQEIITYIVKTENTTNIEFINLIPVYEYISKNNIYLDEEPIYKNFRNNKSQFYEMYTLWDMKNV